MMRLRFTLVMLMAGMYVITSCHQVCFIDPRSGKLPRLSLPNKHPCECTAIRLGGMNIPASSYLQGAPYYLDGLFLSEDPEEIQASLNCTAATTVECSQPLGLEDRIIPNERMTASSTAVGFLSSAARLNNRFNCWSTSRSTGSWIKVDLGEPKLVSGVITQGHYHGNNRVTKYKVAFKKGYSSAVEYVTDSSGNIKVFDGNLVDSSTPITNMFHQSITAVVVRLEIVDWFGYATMRLELLGCEIN